MSGEGGFQNLSEIEPETVRWLWEGRIPFGKVTILEGDPGVGKSTMALELAARVSRGAGMPATRGTSAETEPATVIIYSGDDGLSDTVRPRLDAAGADLKRIWAIDRAITEADFTSLRPALIILDPFSSYASLAIGEPPSKVMRTLGHLAKTSGAAILALQCASEKEHDHHSSDFYGHPRSVLSLSMVGHGGRKLALAKSNLRSLPDVYPLVFHIDEEDGTARIINWSDGR